MAKLLQAHEADPAIFETALVPQRLTGNKLTHINTSQDMFAEYGRWPTRLQVPGPWNLPDRGEAGHFVSSLQCVDFAVFSSG